MKKEITMTREQFFDFIKKDDDHPDLMSHSAKHYLKYFDKYMATGKKGNWNWAVSFFCVWFFLRRMYLYGFIILLIQIFWFVSTNIIVLFILNTTRLPAIIMAVNILFCLFLYRYADYIYLRYADKKISKGISNSGTCQTSALVGFILYYYNNYHFFRFILDIIFLKYFG